MGLLFSIYGKIKNDPNHQPDVYMGGLLKLGAAMGSPMLGNLHISYNDALPMNCFWAWSEHKLMTETIHCDNDT